jgi:hypothetical protein
MPLFSCFFATLSPHAPTQHVSSLALQVGSWYQTFKREYAAVTGNRWNQGSFTAIYRNSDRPSAQWFHDNTYVRGTEGKQHSLHNQACS